MVFSPMTSNRTADMSFIFSHLMAFSIDPVNTLSDLESSCRSLKETKTKQLPIFYIFFAH